jgi:formylglycine-generating enzyme required for sulfatase activity
MLPTEEQWQYAAQGDDGREYPWGNEWDGSKCNNAVSGEWFGFLKSKPEGHGKQTTLVTAYEGKGDSPFGVVDLAGNVWEWCLTEYESGSNDLNRTNVRVRRGGSWDNYFMDYFRVSARGRISPDVRNILIGFRLARP